MLELAPSYYAKQSGPHTQCLLSRAVQKIPHNALYSIVQYSIAPVAGCLTVNVSFDHTHAHTQSVVCAVMDQSCHAIALARGAKAWLEFEPGLQHSACGYSNILLC